MRRLLEGLEANPSRPWKVIVAAVGGLLAVTVLAGVFGLVLNGRIVDVTEDTLAYDVELEDQSDDLRVAILDLRHYHRNITFTGPSRGSLANFENAYAVLHEEIDALQRLGVRDPDSPQPEDLRQMAEEYHAGFEPAIEDYESNSTAFDAASDQGLMDLEQMEAAAQEIDLSSERLAEEALASVDATTATSKAVLLAAIGSLVLIGAVFAYAAVRMAGELRVLHDRERAAAETQARLSRAKTEFLADVSHELRTPLTVLRSNAEVGLQTEREPAYYIKLLDKVSRESSKMSRMVEDLLLLSRSDSASLPLEIEPVDAELFLAEIVGRARGLADEYDTRLHTRLSGQGTLKVDAQKAEQAVLILVDNAAKYSPAGSLVTLTSRAGRGELALKVADEGPGIPDEHLRRVFERFYRVDKTRSRRDSRGGAGLGLPIAKTIAEAHGGRIEAESSPGEGTSMTLFLPLDTATPDEDLYLYSQLPLPSCTSRTETKTGR